MSDRHLTPEQRRRQNLVRQASNPATPAGWLGKAPCAADRKDRALRDALTGNPSTPPARLAKLIDSAPAAFCRNPAAALLVLENPAFLDSVSDSGLAALLRCATAPPALAVAIASGGERGQARLAEAARLHVTQHPEVPDAEWDSCLREYWHQAAGKRMDVDRRHELLELIEVGILPAVFGAYATPDPLDEDDFAAVRRENPTWVETGRRKPPTWVPKRWISGQELHLLRGGAFNPDVTGDTLASWIERDVWIDRAIAAHRNTRPDTLAVLARHMDPAIRRRMLRNPNVTPELLEECRLRALKRQLHPEPTLTAGFPRLLGRFAAMQQAPVAVYRPRLPRMAASICWQDRAAAALAVVPRPNGQPPRVAHILLLEQLTGDGIVLVRAAARARLRGETFAW